MKLQSLNFQKIITILGILIGCSFFLAVGEAKADDFVETTVTSEVYKDEVLDIPELFAMARSTVTITSSKTIGDGIYQLDRGFSGRITIANTATNVKIIGSGTQNSNSDIVFQDGRTGPIVLTIEDLNIFGVTAHGIDFANAGHFENKLYISGENIVIGYWQGAGLHVPDGVNLVIDEAEGAGAASLSAKGGGGAAAIGGYHGSAGSITIAGGKIKAEGGGYSSGGAGIGGGAGGSGGTITITGGEVEATGYLWNQGFEDGNGAGIGGGAGGAGGIITIEGGRVIAKGWNGGAGIGGGRKGAGGEITIKGGEVVAVGGPYVSGATHGGGAGIGGGAGETGGNITIEGGTVTATGGTGTYSDSTIVSAGAGAGIGGGGGSYDSIPGGSGGTITIKGGSVIAEGGPVLKGTSSGLGGAGIGGGGGSNPTLGGSGGSIIIEEGTVEAIGASGGAGIGGGKQNDGGNIIIEGGIVKASSSHSAAGIGGGGNRNLGAGGSGGNIIIRGGIIDAIGGSAGAGIGGGTDGGSGGVITIEGGIVKAQGGHSSAGIGGGYIGNGGTITIINNPTVIATGTYGAADIGNGLYATGSTILKDALNNDLSYIRLAVTYRSAKKPDVTVTMNDIDYITNEDGLTGFFVQENSTQSIGIKAEDLNIDTEITMDRPQSQSIRKTIELSYYRADLTKLLLSKGILEPDFSSDQTSYTVNVGYGTSSITVNPTAEESSSIKVNNIPIANGTNSPSIPLEVENNEVKIVVTAGDGVTQKTYFLNIVRRHQIILSVNGSFTAENKEYDGNVEAVIDSNNLILTGIVGDDDVALNAVVAFDDSQVGEAKNVRLTEASSLIGAQAGDYLLSLTEAPTAKAKIIPKKLTVINAVAQDKVYDGTTHAEISGAELNGGVVEGDEVLLSNHTSGKFAQSGVGSNISVQTEMSLTGDDKGNYTFEQPTLTGNITAKELTVINAVAQDKIYDGTTHAEISGAELVGLVGSDDVEIDTPVGTFAMKNAGMNITVIPELTLKGIDKDNYVLIQPMGLTANIIPKELTVINAVAQNKVYDGTTHAEIIGAELSGVVEGDEVFLSNHTSGEFAQSGIGSDISVLTEMYLTGADINNYTLEQPTLTGNITVRELTVINAVVQDKVYDGTTDAEISGAELSGVIEGENVLLSNHATGEFSQSGVGAHINVITDMFLTGADTSNYTLVQPTLAGNITAKELTVINAAAKDKVYDGTTDAEIINAELSGVVAGDDVLLEVHTIGTFAQANIGTDISLLTNMSLIGDDMSNYTLVQPTLTANITPKELKVINAVAQNKVYDGTTDAEIRNAGLSGMVEGDDVLLENKNVGTFAQANVGTGISVHTEMTVSGRDAGNYSLIQPDDLSADIIVRPLTITADSLHKTYGEIDPELTYQITEGQLVGSDCITGELTRVAGGNSGSYAIEQGSLTAGTNYHITFVGADLIIERKVLTITAENKSKFYGAVDPSFTVVYDGFITGEDENNLSCTLLFSREEGEEAGQYTITPTGLTSINYLIVFVDGTLTILSNNADLSNLALSNLNQSDLTLSPVFDPEITSYTAKVRNSFSIVTLTAVSDDPNAAITVNTIPVASGETSDAISLRVGTNIIIVVVTAEDGETAKTYIITIDRSRKSSGGDYTPTPNQPELETKTNDGEEVTEIFHSETKVISLVLGERVTMVNGMPQILDSAPFIKLGVNRTLVPVRFLSEMLGARVQWQAETQQVIIVHHDTEIILTIGSDKVLVNGNTIILDCPAELLSSGRTFVPLRFVSEALGSGVRWNDAAKTITIMQFNK